MREAHATINRGRRSSYPAADADGWETLARVPQPGPAAAIKDGAAAVPSRMEREIRDLEIAALEQRVEENRRRQVEREHAARSRASDAEIAALREQVVELAKAANTFADATADRVEAQDAEIAALRTRCEQLERRKAARATRSKNPTELPALPRLVS